MVRLLTIVAILAGCTSNDPEALDARAAAALHELATIYADNPNDCDKLAAQLDAFATKYTPTFQALEDSIRSGGKNDWDGKHEDVKAELRDKSQPALRNCATNRKVLAASSRLRLD